MHIFLGKILKHVLWLSLFALIGAFLFGLMKFDWNFVKYVDYLNNMSITQLINDDNSIQNTVEENIDEQNFVQEELNSTEEDYFLPEAKELEDDAFGFSGNLDSEVESVASETGNVSISEKDLINLIKSEK